MVTVAVRIGHGAQQHAVFRIDKLILSVALLDFEHIDRLQTFTRQLVRIVHMPCGVLAAFESGAHRLRQQGVRYVLFGHVPFARGVEPRLHVGSAFTEFGDQIALLPRPFDMSRTGEHPSERILHCGRNLHRIVVVIAARHRTQRREGQHQHCELFHNTSHKGLSTNCRYRSDGT